MKVVEKLRTYKEKAVLVFTDPPGVVACNVGILIGSSDHCYVFATVRTEQAVPDVTFSRKIYMNHELTGVAFCMIFLLLISQTSIGRRIVLHLLMISVLE